MKSTPLLAMSAIAAAISLQAQAAPIQPTTISGDYQAYVDNDVANLKSPLLDKALQNNGQLLKAVVNKASPEAAAYDLVLKAVDDGSKSYQGAVIYSSMGPDASARDTLSVFHRHRLLDGFVLSAYLTHGFSDLRTDSKDGKYESAFFDLERVTPYGLVNASYSYSQNNAGGDTKIYVLGGQTERYALSVTNWLTNSISAATRIEHVERSQDFGAFDIDESQRYSVAGQEFAYKGQLFSSRISLKKGFDGHQDYSLIPLMGTFNPHFWSATADVGVSSMIGSVLGKARIIGFKGSEDMPSSERIGLGGQGAGSSHESGLYTGYQGYQYDLSVSQPIGMAGPLHVAAKAGINGSSITTALQEDLAVTAAEVGLEMTSRDWTIQTSFSKSISDKNTESDQRINAQVIWRY